MSDLISRSALIEKLEKSIKWCEDNLENSTASFQSGCIAAIKDIISSVKMEETCPSIEAEPVKHGHWVDGTLITKAGKYNAVGCSICRQVFNYPNAKDLVYCPACGAKMDEEET